MYKNKFEHIEETNTECVRKIHFNKNIKKNHYYEIDLKQYNIETLIEKIENNSFLKSSNKDFNSSKYFQKKDLIFMLLSPLLFDELVQDEFIQIQKV